MPITVEFPDGPNLVVLRFSGVTSMAQWRAAVDGVLSRKDLHDGICWLSDRRVAEDVPDSAFVRMIAEYVAAHDRFFRGCGWALVTNSQAEYGMARMAEILADACNISMRAFQDYDKALLWLQTPRSNSSAST